MERSDWPIEGPRGIPRESQGRSPPGV